MFLKNKGKILKKIDLKEINYGDLQNEVNSITTDREFWNEQEIFFKDESAKRTKEFQKYHMNDSKFQKHFSL